MDEWQIIPGVKITSHLDDWALPLRVTTYFYDYPRLLIQFLCFSIEVDRWIWRF